MRYVRRDIEPVLKAAAKEFPAVVVTGPRRAGKTCLLRRLFPAAEYALLEDPDVVARVRADPRGFLDALAGNGPSQRCVILDEVQHTPELFAYVRSRIDARPRQTGRWLLTGSQESPLMQGVSESMAGRAAVLHLLPLSHHESPRVGPATGGYPEPLARPRSARLWFSSYVQTYLERDVRAVTAIRDLSTFRRFIGLLASRHGQLLNKTDLAAPLGVSIPTITQWLGILEITGQIIVVPPFFENAGKRLVKSPKVYIADSGLACHLLGIETQKQLDHSPFRRDLRGIHRGRDRQGAAECRLPPRALPLSRPAGAGGRFRRPQGTGHAARGMQGVGHDLAVRRGSDEKTGRRLGPRSDRPPGRATGMRDRSPGTG